MKQKHIKMIKEAMEGMAASHNDLSEEHAKMAEASSEEKMVTGHTNAASLHKVLAGHCDKLAGMCDKLAVSDEEETHGDSFGSRNFEAATRISDLETKIATMSERFGLNKIEPTAVSAVAPSQESLTRTVGKTSEQKHRLVARPGEDQAELERAMQPEKELAKVFPGFES